MGGLCLVVDMPCRVRDAVRWRHLSQVATRCAAMVKRFNSLEDAFAYLSDDVTRLSGEVLAANVLAAVALKRAGIDADVAAEARALLAQVELKGGDAEENEALMQAARARLNTLLDDLSARH